MSDRLRAASEVYGFINQPSTGTAGEQLMASVFDRFGKKVCETIQYELKDADECRSIKATLFVNCQPGRLLHNLGCTYDEKKSVHTNLIGILEKLTLKDCER